LKFDENVRECTSPTARKKKRKIREQTRTLRQRGRKLMSAAAGSPISKVLESAKMKV
jgi:hypothetical protein